MKKFLKELLGTALLILIACGIASTSNIILATSVNLPGAFSILTIAITFGLSYYITTIIFSDECAFNPILTILDILNKKTKLLDGIKNIVAQFLGGILGAELLGFLLNGNYGALGANAYGELSIIGSNLYQAFAVEFIISLILGLVYLQVAKENKAKALSFTIMLIYLFAIPYTNASANPARSLGPAIMMGGTYLKQVWLFIIAPTIGGILSLPIHKLITKK